MASTFGLGSSQGAVRSMAIPRSVSPGVTVKCAGCGSAPTPPAVYTATAKAPATNRAPSLRRRYFARFAFTEEIYGRDHLFPTVFFPPTGTTLTVEAPVRFTKMQLRWP